MRTSFPFNFCVVGIRTRIIATLIAASLVVCVVVWGLGRDVNGKAAAISSVAPSGFLYVLHNCNDCPNEIFGFAVDETTGTLTPLTDGFPVLTGGDGFANSRGDLLAVDANNLRLFAVNEGSNTISAFRINPLTGKLDAMFNPIDLGPGLWTTTSVHSSCSESLVVIGSTATDPGGQLASVRITATDGTAISLKSIDDAGVPFSSVFRRDGKFVYIGGGGPGNKFAAFSIAADGTLNLIGTFDSGSSDPRAYATDAAGRLFMANRFPQQQQVRAFNTDANGIPTLIASPSVVSTLREASRGVMLANDRFYAFSNGSKLIAVYRISSTGTMTQVNTPFRSAGDGVTGLAVNRDGKLLFALNHSTQNVTTFRVDATSGALTDLLKTRSVINTNRQLALNGMAYLPPLDFPTLAPTTTTITADTVNVVRPFISQTAPVTVKVTSECGIPSGKVYLAVDGKVPVEKPLSADGTAIFDIVVRRPADIDLTATFPAQDGFGQSSKTGALLVRALVTRTTTTTITAPTITLSEFGPNAHVTVKVTSPVEIPTGRVSLTIDNGSVLTKVLTGGSATFIITKPAAGTHSLEAIFTGTLQFASSKAIGTLVVKPPPVVRP